MKLKQKILAAGLAAIIAGFGIFGANSATAQTDTANTNSTIAQMMAMIESLKQQIAQIIALIAQLKPQETCGNGICRFGETATTCAADCGKPASDNGKAKCSATSGVWAYSDCASGCVYNTKAERVAGGKVCATVCVKDFTCECAGGKYWASREEGCIAKFTAACGNGTCDTYETADTCPADCKTASCVAEWHSCSPDTIREALAAQMAILQVQLAKATDSEEIASLQAQLQALISRQKTTSAQCCSGMICRIGNNDVSGICVKETSCGNGTCEAGETNANCAKDCPGLVASCARENESFIDAGRQCCDGLQKTRAACSDATCYTCKKNCASEGQTINKLYSPLQTSTLPTACCAGLTAYSGANYTVQNGVCARKQYTVMETTAVCLKCGDGVCNAAAGENICGCPADCTTPACVNECSSAGAKQCFGNSYQTCGNYDTDNCLEWSTATACASNQICQNGACGGAPAVTLKSYGEVCTANNQCVSGNCALDSCFTIANCLSHCR